MSRSDVKGGGAEVQSRTLQDARTSSPRRRRQLTVDDFRGLSDLAQATGKRFRAGVVLYRGSTIIPFGARQWAVPVSALYSETQSG